MTIDKALIHRSILWLLVLITLTAVSCGATADYRLDVWEKNVPRSQPPLAMKRYISFYDCRDEREWLLSLMTRIDFDVYITCYKTDE